MAAFGMPGFLELLILGGICFLLFIVPAVVIVIVVLTSRRSETRQNPNLQPCIDCGKLVSIHAASCPNCGCPVKKESGN